MTTPKEWSTALRSRLDGCCLLSNWPTPFGGYLSSYTR
jgi:hypothetical protein